MGEVIERGSMMFERKRINDLTDALINNGSLPPSKEFSDRSVAVKAIAGIFMSCHALKEWGFVSEQESEKILDELVKRGLLEDKTGS